MSKRISVTEPAAERPYTVALSLAEVNALVNHHIAQTKRVTKIVGNKLLNFRASTLLPTRQESNIYIDEGRKIVAAHADRARHLVAIMKS